MISVFAVTAVLVFGTGFLILFDHFVIRARVKRQYRVEAQRAELHLDLGQDLLTELAVQCGNTKEDRP